MSSSRAKTKTAVKARIQSRAVKPDITSLRPSRRSSRTRNSSGSCSGVGAR